MSSIGRIAPFSRLAAQIRQDRLDFSFCCLEPPIKLLSVAASQEAGYGVQGGEGNNMEDVFPVVLRFHITRGHFCTESKFDITLILDLFRRPDTESLAVGGEGRETNGEKRKREYIGVF